MIKSELIRVIGSKLAISKNDIELVVNSAIAEINNALQNNEKVELRGLGSFSITNKAERMGRNPKTGEDITISARSVVSFKASTTLKEAINS